MEFRGIPVRTIGPGSQPGEPDGQSLAYIDMPKGMSTYTPPAVLDPERISALDGAKEALRWLQSALDRHDAPGQAMLADLTALDDASREIVNQVLGEGEVAINIDGSPRVRIQESVLAGVWRTFVYDAEDRIAADLLEVGEIPALVRDDQLRVRRIDIDADGAGPEIANALPILVEVDGYRSTYTPGAPGEVINLSLLPVSDADIEFLDERLGRSGIDILSRAYGKCRITATAVPNVWWVRYFNSMDILILNTIEVIDIPRVACAAPEDLRDSALRLGEILEPYRQEFGS